MVNLSLMIGGRYFGLRGALVALAGMLTVPLMVVLLLALLYAGYASHPVAQGALRGMGAVAAGLITATGLKLIGALRSNPMGHVTSWVFALLTFAAIGIFRLPLAAVLLTIGVAACVWTYRQLGQAEKART